MADVIDTNLFHSAFLASPFHRIIDIKFGEGENPALSEKTIKKLDEEISAKDMTLKCKDALIESRKNDVAEWEEKAEYSKLEYLKADELLIDKKKEVEQAQGELSKVTEKLDEATRKKEIALDRNQN